MSQSRDVSFYIDKVLAYAMIMSGIVLAIRLWAWPIAIDNIKASLPYAVICLLGMVFAKRKMLILVTPLSFVSIRLIIGTLIQWSPQIFGMAIILCFVTLLSMRSLRLKLEVEDYPAGYEKGEMLFDVLAIPAVFLLVFKLIPRIMRYF